MNSASVRKSAIRKIRCGIVALLILSSYNLTACSERFTDQIIVAGSTSVQPYAEVLAEEYAHSHPDTAIDIQGGGSSAGITAALSGTAEIGMSSRLLKESEQELWIVEIAKDGLAIIVHPDNPINNLSIEQIRDIYTTRINNWSQVGGEAHRIHVITREDGSGTRSAFEDLVMGGQTITPRAIVQDSNGAVRQIIAGDPNAIGFISLGLVEVGEKPVKALSLGGVVPTHENVINGSYNLTRPFLFVCQSEPVGAVREFIDFVLSEHGREILSAEGLIVGEQK
jgi:phosphate transport system substrate-binding protein